MKEIIKAILKDFHKRGVPMFVNRDLNIPLNSGKVISIIGPRRSGKTYIMYQAISQIADITNVIYFNFEDERLDLTSKDLHLIIEAYFELYPDKKEKDLFLFFDEIQEINGWETFVRRVYDTLAKNVFVTGSSSKLLSREIATSLRGRTITYEVLPLSFHEYLRFRECELDIHSTKGKSRIISEFSSYLKKGGFPETVHMEGELYDKTLRSYFELMFYKDIVERHEVTNPLPLKLFIKRLVANTSKEFSVHKIFNQLKSEGIKISKDSLYKYLDYCEEAYLLFPVKNFSESAAKQKVRKVYSIDNGLSSALSFSLSEDLGRLFENVVMLELKRRYEDVFYYKDSLECDFVIKVKNQIFAVQVCYNLNEENRKREIAGLKEAMKRFNLKKGLILTLDQHEKIGSIEVVPIYSWLLRTYIAK